MIKILKEKCCKKFLAAVFALAIIIVTSGCHEIEYSEFSVTETTTPPIITEISSDITTTTAPVTAIAENTISTPVITQASFSTTIQAEESEDDSLTALDGYTGKGYIQLLMGDYRTFMITVPESQHYKITVRVCSQSSKMKLIVGGSELITDRVSSETTVDGIIHGIYNIKEALYFQDFSLDGVYMEAGENRLTVQTVTGTAYLDSITVEDGKTPSDNLYNISSLPVDKDANGKTIEIMSYLKSIYGKKTLTAQYVTPNTNTEAEAIYMAAKRFPAIRCADLYPYSSYNPEYGTSENIDLELAAEWSEQGGLVSYSWSWYAPVNNDVSHYYAARTNFDVKRVFQNTSNANLANITPEELADLYGLGEITEEAYNLINDIDNMAQNLAWLEEKDVTVLFRPLMEGGSGQYWWDTDRDSYIQLWQLLVERINNYHQLHNIIWVWTGDKYDFYPGDDYVDILGADVYNHMPGSSIVQFSDISKFSIKTKAAAMTETCILPDPDTMYRDNAKWLWTAVWRGDYIINSDGSLCNQWTSEEQLVYYYNHEAYLTRDELPQF